VGRYPLYAQSGDVPYCFSVVPFILLNQPIVIFSWHLAKVFSYDPDN
jgi:hypothetical protein